MTYKLIFLIGIMAFYITACIPCPTYNLKVMPEYNYEIVNEYYQEIYAIKQYYNQLVTIHMQMVMMGIEIPVAGKGAIEKNEDIYLYWIAVAVIHAYHQDLEAARTAGRKAQAGLDAIKEVLKNAAGAVI
jgi:hypothetical protein